ncbi:alkaline phosphatase family protein [Natrinema salifodinae]|uniref:Type I phosphodiesterase / nucleotide pyrophosphatase n=1 Tax=Natrinema salifodinae TaxID=1202768 RepID=A0A1I0M627_9EURY|nr:alkaline phosphatase family protein [Natrinema salifodinae]SEV83925.1 Type I phosphodiesterase / nucleotide pyrophosphatase [Natrinema salifodinae]
MSDTICVLGIDAADYELAKEWDCDNLLLETSNRLTVEPYSLDVPATLEVWPSIATGASPDDHGITLHPTESGEFEIRQFLTLFGSKLPDPVKKPLKRAYNEVSSTGYPTTDRESMFQKGTVYNWPGVTPCYDWDRELEWFRGVQNGDVSESEFCQRSFGLAGKGVGWLRSQAMMNVPIAGAHVHYLDSTGHIYADRPERLREHYERMDELVAELRDRTDHLLIVSDHGMKTAAVDDAELGVHSMRPFISSSKDAELPGHVLEIREWVEKLVDGEMEFEDASEIDAPTEHLADLGYL